MICVICKQKIIEKKERWVRLTDFDRGKQTGERFYHLECWRDRFRISNSERKQKMYHQFQESIGKIVGAINPKIINPHPNKTYEITS